MKKIGLKWKEYTNIHSPGTSLVKSLRVWWDDEKFSLIRYLPCVCWPICSFHLKPYFNTHYTCLQAIFQLHREFLYAGMICIPISMISIPMWMFPVHAGAMCIPAGTIYTLVGTIGNQREIPFCKWFYI